MIYLYPYRQGSRSANRIARELGGRCLRLEGSSYDFNPKDTIINWGNSKCPYPGVLNTPAALAFAANKRQAFKIFREKGVQCPNFATTREAVSWDQSPTVVRHKLTGHSGEGIEIVEAGDPLPLAPLYVQYMKKKDEFRVHIVGEEIIAVQRKALRSDYGREPNWKVRNHSNGFVFVRGGFDVPEQVLEQARKAIKALALDFGGVDVIWNASSQQAFVLEVNTAPGLEGQTVLDYAEGFTRLIGLIKERN